MGTFEDLHKLEKIEALDSQDLRAGTNVSVTPEDIKAAVYAQQQPQPTSPLHLETLDAGGTTPSSPTTPQNNFVPKVPTPKAPRSSQQLDNGSPTSGKQQEYDEPEL